MTDKYGISPPPPSSDKVPCPVLRVLNEIRSGGYTDRDESLPPVSAPIYSGGGGETIEVAMDEAAQWTMMERLALARNGGSAGGILGRIAAMAAGNHISNVAGQARAAVARGQAAIGNNAGDRLSYMATHSPHGRALSAVLGDRVTSELAHTMGDMAGSASASLGELADSTIDRVANSAAKAVTGSAEDGKLSLGQIYDAVDEQLLRPQLDRAYAAASRELARRMPDILDSKWAKALKIPSGSISGGGDIEEDISRMVHILGDANAILPVPPLGLTDREKKHIPVDLPRAIAALGERLQKLEHYYAEIMQLIAPKGL